MNLDTPTLEYLELDELHPATDNVRTELRDIPKLTASVKAIGILEPLIVTPNGDGYTIVAGARRHAAAKSAELTTVPCIVRPTMETAERVEAMGSENLQRDGLTPIEEATVYQRLADAGMSQRTIAEHFGCNQSHVSKRMKLLELPDDARARIADGRMHVDVGVKLVQLKNADPDGFTKYMKSNPSPSTWSIDNKLGDIQRKKREAKLAKPYVDKGLKHLGRPDHMKYEGCTEKQASAFSFDWRDEVQFLREKTVTKAAANGAPAKPPRETKKQREAREARDREQLDRLAACAEVLDDVQPPTAAHALGLLAVDRLLDDAMGDDITVLCGLLGVRNDEHNYDPLIEFVRASPANARRAGIAALLVITHQRWGHSSTGAHAEGLRLLLANGAELTNDEQESIRRDDEWKPAEVQVARECRICHCTDDNACDDGCTWVDENLCSSCTDAVDTTHDPDCPTSVTEVKDHQLAKDSAFADANDLAPGDEVHEDGSITRAGA